jgi:starch phosphorylase
MRRMIKEYTNNYYVPEMQQSIRIAQNNYKPARELAAWKEHVQKGWSSLELYVEGRRDGQLSLGEGIDVRAWIKSDNLTPDDLCVELVYGNAKDDAISGQHALPMSYSKRELDGSYRYDIHLRPTESGSFAYNVRVVPFHTGLTEKYEMGLIRWA